MERFEGRFFERLLAQSIADDLAGLSTVDPVSGPPLLRDLVSLPQRDKHLRKELMASDGTGEVLQLSAEAAAEFPGVAWAAGYIVDETSGGLDLIAKANVPDAVLPLIERYQPDAHMSVHVRTGHPTYLVRMGRKGVPDLASMFVLPICHHGEAVACLTIASNSEDALSERTRHLIEEVSDYAGIVISRILAEERARKIESGQQDMLASLVHSLKTPLAIMNGYIDLLLSQRQGAAEPFDHERILRKVMLQSEHVSKLVTDLIDLEDVSSGELLQEPCEVPLGAIVDQVVERLESEAADRVLLEGSQQEVRALGEESWLAHAIKQVIVNALRFSSAFVHVQIRSTDKDAIVDVIDHGSGISPEELPHIFERFYHASYLPNGRPNPGVGLGLTLAKSIVERFHGSIHVASAVEEGSRFSIVLPRAINNP